MSTDRHEYRDMLGVGPYHLEDDMNMTTCTTCGRPAKMWGHDGKCPDCIAATTSFGKEWTAQSDSADADVGQMPRSPVYYHAECGCELRDDKKIRWCAHHVSGLQETIKAREREASDLRYRVRERQKDVDILAKQLRDRAEERDERDATIRILRRQKRAISQFARRMKADRDEWKAKSEGDTLDGWAAEKIGRLQDELQGWKAKAEQSELEYQNALQDGSICPAPEEHGDALQQEIDILSKQLRERTREADALQDAVKHLREQIPDMSSNASMWKAYKSDRDYWKDVAHKARKHEDEALKALSQRTHYCCMHMRWETREGTEV